MGEHKRFFKAIQMGNRNNIVYAIFADAKEYCKPNFTSIQGAAKQIFTQRLIYIPIFYEQLLMFAVQMESEVPTLVQSTSQNKSPTMKYSKASRIGGGDSPSKM